MNSASFAPDDFHNFDKARSLEWIETNGLGGYASSTVSGANSRRYHGLLVASMKPPVERVVVLSKLDETIIIDDKRIDLSANQYPGTVHPRGFIFLKSFERDLFPVFHYKAEGIELKKTIAAINGENTTLVLYEVISASKKFILELMPLYASKDFHTLAHGNDFIGTACLFTDDVFRTLNYHGSPELFIAIPGASFTEQRDWYYNFENTIEQERGLDFKEDLYTHGRFSVELKKGDKLGIIVSTEDPTGKDAFTLFKKEKKRREGLITDFDSNESLKRLELAADQFIVQRGKLSTIIAGYHWFADWGRDTMIALPGLCLATGRFKEAKQILKTFAESVNEGMLPNRFPDHGETPEYNTVDATLWFFHAIHQYYIYTGDKAFVKSLVPVLKEIIDWHYKGTRYNIHVDPIDELLYAGQEGVQLTWMDAKVGDWVVTPRKGKAVEINALWYNALCVMGFLITETKSAGFPKMYKDKAEKVYQSFNAQFWNDNYGCLYDYIDGDYKNDEVRPNQIYAISLPFSVLDKSKALKVFKFVKEFLSTPRGLRSLGSMSREYKPYYSGDIWNRDGAYHQGTVWSFLIGPYIDSLIKLEEKKGKAEARKFMAEFFNHLNEAGVGSISEIFDAEAPHHPRGCIAQAWGVGEVLRVCIEHGLTSEE
ncbi:MAG TPA: amylo-alpha-1,6-glucosidase [Cyclobacteriaceae bacterium]